MPVLLEGTAVVIRNDALDRCLDAGASDFNSIAPNAMSYSDGEISQASFMSPRDAEFYRDKLLLMGLRGDDFAPEVVVVDAHNRMVSPSCDWLVLMEYKGNLIGSMAGNDSDVVIAPESWDPDAGPSLQHMSAEDVASRLEYVRREGRVDVYQDKESGQLLYSARLHETPEEQLRQAAEVVLRHCRRPGDPVPSNTVQVAVRRAIGRLQQLALQHDDTWRIWFLLGKAWHIVDRSQRSIAALERAVQAGHEHGQGHESEIYKELSGVLLQSGQSRDACEAAEKAVACHPDDVELLGNLSIAYLLDGRFESAEKTLNHALTIAPNDPTNRFLQNKLHQISSGRIRTPKSLAELEGREQSTVPDSTARRDSKHHASPGMPSWISRLMHRITKRR